MSNSENPEAGGEAAGQGNASSRQNTTAPVKCAYVCPNGSRYGKVRKVVIPSRLRNRWEGVLQLVDDSVPTFGGCYHLVKVGENGEYSKVSAFDEIEDQELYVALNNTEKLIKMDYKGLMNSSRSPSPPRRSQQSTASRQPRQRRHIEVESKYHKSLPRLIIKIYANNMYRKAPVRAALERPEVYERRANVFKNKVCSAMDFVFKDIEDSCSLTLRNNHHFDRLIHVESKQEVRSPYDILDGQVYVMCGGTEDYKEFELHSVARPFHCGKFSHDRQRFLNNPRSAKVKDNKSSRKQKSQDTARETARDDKTDRSGKENGDPHGNGYDSHQDFAYDSREPESQYGQETSRQNGFHEYENGDDYSNEQPQQNDFDDEYRDIPRFGDADAPLLTDRKSNNAQGAEEANGFDSNDRAPEEQQDGQGPAAQ